jgi:phosphoribosyl 1,2-cyclic phosphodiesterase
LDLGRLKTVLVSRKPSGQVSGTGPLARKLALTVRASVRTLPHLQDRLANVRVQEFEVGDTFAAGNFKVRTCPVPHDAADPAAFAVEGRSVCLGVVTDLGQATQLVRDHFRKMTALIVEFNHDLEMLINGPYTWPLKQRVRSRYGHLSNEDGAALLAELGHPGLRRIVLGHLSETNSTPQLALAAARQVLEKSGFQPEQPAAGQPRPSAVFELQPAFLSGPASSEDGLARPPGRYNHIIWPNKNTASPFSSGISGLSPPG